jgi:hypothetical protein
MWILEMGMNMVELFFYNIIIHKLHEFFTIQLAIFDLFSQIFLPASLEHPDRVLIRYDPTTIIAGENISCIITTWKHHPIIEIYN